ncbi:NADH dehydrogenase [Nocardiopsis sp. TSRI0078]|uniref:proton-conducting transporter transmembrane domain-containing protein n=1 Tax=unclassified Nocardiopsis TaxID=2649073 RepID=UPI00093C9CDB|nr:proton-conducting transporter membrane subunit [Nocardiopsis sp. TSRI0078]OKI13075.1 NADH dehydrogenase [Nocardiopsis sp. TSRI0078]
MTASLWALVGLPAAAGAVLLVAGRRADPVAAPCAVATAGLTLVAAAVAAVSRPSTSAPMLAGIGAGAAVDGLSAVAVLTVATVAAAVVLFASAEMGSDQARGRFFGLMLLFTAAMLATVTATGLFTLLAAWEVMGALSYALIGYWWGETSRVRSATLAFVTTRTGDLGLYLAAGAALAGGSGALRLSELAALDGGWRDAAVAGVVLAALGKSAQLPFSFWLSHAMAGPTPVSALLHSATMVAAGGYLLLRIEPALAATAWAGPALVWVGAATALLLGAVAFHQTDLKQLLAASTCSQLGFVVLAAGAGSVGGGMLQFTAHAAAKSLLFLCAGTWLAARGTQELGGLRGAARGSPPAGAAFAVGALAVAGLPPLPLWTAKDEVLAAALHLGPLPYAAGLAASAVSAAYAARALAAVWAPPPAGEGGAPRRGSEHRSPPSEVLPPVALAAATVGLGVLVLPAAARWWRALLGASAEPGPAGWETAVSGLLAAVVLIITWRACARGRGEAVPGRRWAGGWLGLEAAANTLVARPVTALARALAALDDRVVAGGARAAAHATTSFSAGLADLDDRVLARGVRSCASGGRRAADLARDRGEAWADGAVRAVASGARILAGWALRPQTGLLHQYYVQAVVALVVLAAVVVLMR